MAQTEPRPRALRLTATEAWLRHVGQAAFERLYTPEEFAHWPAI